MEKLFKVIKLKNIRKKIKEELDRLIEEGKRIVSLSKGILMKRLVFNNKLYQKWFTEAKSIIEQLVPDRYDEFIECYNSKIDFRSDQDVSNYSIIDFLLGRDIDDYVTKYRILNLRVNTQLGILMGARSRLDSHLDRIEGVLQADIFDNELEAADHLLKNGFIRSAGVIAGIVLEGHLRTVCKSHKITIPKKPTISPLNQELKNNEIISISQWRHIQHLNDIRNECSHKREKEPSQKDVIRLLKDVKEIIETIY